MDKINENLVLDRTTGQIKIHKTEDSIGMRKVGKLAAELLDLFVDEVQPGISTESLDKFAYEFILDNKAIPAPLNYKGFPKSVCTSVNHVVCHGIPSENKILNNAFWIMICHYFFNLLFTFPSSDYYR